MDGYKKLKLKSGINKLTLIISNIEQDLDKLMEDLHPDDRRMVLTKVSELLTAKDLRSKLEDKLDRAREMGL